MELNIGLSWRNEPCVAICTKRLCAPLSRRTCAVAAAPRKTSLAGSAPATARTSSSIRGAAGSGMPSTSDPPDRLVRIGNAQHQRSAGQAGLLGGAEVIDAGAGSVGDRKPVAQCLSPGVGQRVEGQVVQKIMGR